MLRTEKRTLEVPTLTDAELLAAMAPPTMERVEFSVDWSDNEPTVEIPRPTRRCWCVLCAGAPL